MEMWMSDVGVDSRFAVKTISTSVSSMISVGELIIWRMLLEL